MVDSPEQLPVRLDGWDAGGHLDCRSGAVRQTIGAKAHELKVNQKSEQEGVECTPPHR